MATKPLPEERLMAAIAHLGAAGFGIGLPLCAILWAENRQKSRYVAYHTLQAYGYQSLGFTIYTLAEFTIALIVSGTLLAVSSISGQSRPPTAMLYVEIPLIVVSLLIYLLLPVIAAVATLLGRDFQYPWLGGRLARYINYDPANPESEINWEHEDRYVASMSHFAVLVMFWGLLGPLAIWLMGKQKSYFLRFQTIQVLVYQGIGTVVYVVYLALIFILMFAGLGLIATISQAENTPIEALFGFLLTFFCCMGLFALLLPSYHILGQWAGLRILQGHDYRYPLIGRWLAGRVKPDLPLESAPAETSA